MAFDSNKSIPGTLIVIVYECDCKHMCLCEHMRFVAVLKFLSIFENNLFVVIYCVSYGGKETHFYNTWNVESLRKY